jgi:hypothetical protein
MDPSILDPKSDNKIRLLPKLIEVGFIEGILEYEKPKGYWAVVNRTTRQLWIEAVDKELDSIDRAGTWDVVDKFERENKVGSKWVIKEKRLADGSIDKFKVRYVVQNFTQCLGFDLDKTLTPLLGLIPFNCDLPFLFYKVSIYSK